MESRKIICHIYLALGLFTLVNVLSILAASEARDQSAFWLALFLPALLFIVVPLIVLVRTSSELSPRINQEHSEWKQFLKSDVSLRYLPVQDRERLYAEFQAQLRARERSAE